MQQSSGEAIRGDSTVALTVTSESTSEALEAAEEVRTRLFGLLVSQAIFSQVLPPGKPADYTMNVSLGAVREVSQGARILVGVMAGANELAASVTLTDNSLGTVVRQFTVTGESASHPLSTENGMADAIREATSRIVQGLRSSTPSRSVSAGATTGRTAPAVDTSTTDSEAQQAFDAWMAVNGEAFRHELAHFIKYGNAPAAGPSGATLGTILDTKVIARQADVYVVQITFTIVGVGTSQTESGTFLVALEGPDVSSIQSASIPAAADPMAAVQKEFDSWLLRNQDSFDRSFAHYVKNDYNAGGMPPDAFLQRKSKPRVLERTADGYVVEIRYTMASTANVYTRTERFRLTLAGDKLAEIEGIT